MQDLTFFIHFIIFIVDMLFFIRQSCVRVGNRANKRFYCALRNGFTLRVFLSKRLDVFIQQNDL